MSDQKPEMSQDDKVMINPSQEDIDNVEGRFKEWLTRQGASDWTKVSRVFEHKGREYKCSARIKGGGGIGTMMIDELTIVNNDRQVYPKDQLKLKDELKKKWDAKMRAKQAEEFKRELEKL